MKQKTISLLLALALALSLAGCQKEETVTAPAGVAVHASRYGVCANDSIIALRIEPVKFLMMLDSSSTTPTNDDASKCASIS